jgi:hypothetical protein
MLLLAILSGFPDSADRIFTGLLTQDDDGGGSGAFFQSTAIAEWASGEADQFRRAVDSIADGALPSLSVFRRWVPRVARFSFQSSRLYQGQR